MPPTFRPLLLVLLMTQIARAQSPVLRLTTDPAGKVVTFLSWDTEGGDRVRTNLLRAPVKDVAATPHDAGGFSCRLVTSSVTFPFDPRVTPTTVLPAKWNADGTFALPA